jgi:hypothetical protein
LERALASCASPADARGVEAAYWLMVCEEMQRRPRAVSIAK